MIAANFSAALAGAREKLDEETVAMAIIIVHHDSRELMNLSVHVAGDVLAAAQAVANVGNSMEAQLTELTVAQRRATQ